jgi:hypothetical protein
MSERGMDDFSLSIFFKNKIIKIILSSSQSTKKRKKKKKEKKKSIKHILNFLKLPLSLTFMTGVFKLTSKKSFSSLISWGVTRSATPDWKS